MKRLFTITLIALIPLVAWATICFSPSVSAKISLPLLTVPTVLLNTPFTVAIPICGTPGTIACAVASGKLPPGMTISATQTSTIIINGATETVPASCVVSGSPSAPGTYLAHITATSLGAKAAGLLHINVNMPNNGRNVKR